LRPLRKAAAVFLVPVLIGCPSATRSSAPAERTGAPEASAATPPTTPQVMLTWQLFETNHALDANGQDRASAVFELLVNGGTPARVSLGRRAAQGCVVSEPGGEPAVVASLDCYAFAHGEYARVVRTAPGELRVEAFGQDEALPGFEPPRTGATAATVRIPEGAEIVVDPSVGRVPDETPSH
jgi:hypothetical protein